MFRNWATRSFGLLTVTCLFATICSGVYTPPKPRVEPLFPKGLRVSIPDESGISLIAFHGKINEDFDALEGGTLSKDVIRARNGRWTYLDRTVHLKKGDVIYFWMHVVFEGLGYNLLFQNHTVTEFYNENGTPVSEDNIPSGIPDRVQPPTSETPPTQNHNQNCERSSTVLGTVHPCKGELIFQEQFDKIDRTRWRLVEQFPDSADGEFVVYQGNEENVNVKDGILRLKPTLLERKYDKLFVRTGTLDLKRCTEPVGSGKCEKTGGNSRILPPVISGRVDTKNSFSFLYGRVEIRAKLPRGDWLYPLITLEPLENTYGYNYQSGQLRVASAVGNTVLFSKDGADISGKLLVGGAVVSQIGNVRDNTVSKKTGASHWADDYHTYELEWTKDRIIVRVDGAEYGNKENPAANYKTEVLGTHAKRWASKNAPFDKPFYLNLGVSAGGLGEFPDNCSSNGYAKPWRNREFKALFNFFNSTEVWSRTWADEATTLKVDYIKVWAL